MENVQVQNVIAIDPGNRTSGVAVLTNLNPLIGFTVDNHSIIDKVQNHISENSIIVIEDIRPYSLQLSMQVIDTCKFIGELQYRLRNEVSADFTLESRASVKEWIFNRFPDICKPRIADKIERLHRQRIKTGKRGLQNQDGEMRKPSFVYVDDRIVIAAMKAHWGIPTPKVGKTTKYGLNSHSWQALALGSYYLSKKTAIG